MTASVPALPLSTRWFQSRLTSSTRLRRGLAALAAVALAYGGSILLLALGGAGPGPAPWLALPRATYFYWEAAFIAPVIVSGAVLAAGVMHLLARALGGKGAFDDAMALIGLAVAWSTLPTLVPDAAIGLLLTFGAIDAQSWMHAITHPTVVLAGIWVYLLIYLACFLVSFPAVARVVYGLRGWRGLLLGWSSFALYQLFLYVFIR